MNVIPTGAVQVPAGQDTFLDHATLQFDLRNPRFPEQEFTDEFEVAQYLYDHADVDELMQSMLSAGYIDFEPLIVLEPGHVVLEGNRRLAALRLISNAAFREQLKVTLPTIQDPKPIPATIRCRVVASRAEAREFIGFKHINGPFKWDALSKAKYAAQWLEDGGELTAISRTLGDNHNTVRRLVNGWYVLQQAIADGFDTAQISKKAFAFSHLYTALTRTSIRELLGIAAEDNVDVAPQPNPIGKDHGEDLQRVMSWLYGQEQRNEPTLIQSQNPNLNQLSRVIAHPEAKRMLLATRSLAAAFERVEPGSDRFEDALMRSSRQAEEALTLAAHYNGDGTLMSVAENLQRTVRGLLAVMRDKSNAEKDSE